MWSLYWFLQFSTFHLFLTYSLVFALILNTFYGSLFVTESWPPPTNRSLFDGGGFCIRNDCWLFHQLFFCLFLKLIEINFRNYWIIFFRWFCFLFLLLLLWLFFSLLFILFFNFFFYFRLNFLFNFLFNLLYFHHFCITTLHKLRYKNNCLLRTWSVTRFFSQEFIKEVDKLGRIYLWNSFRLFINNVVTKSNQIVPLKRRFKTSKMVNGTTDCPNIYFEVVRLLLYKFRRKIEGRTNSSPI